MISGVPDPQPVRASIISGSGNSLFNLMGGSPLADRCRNDFMGIKSMLSGPIKRASTILSEYFLKNKTCVYLSKVDYISNFTTQSISN